MATLPPINLPQISLFSTPNAQTTSAYTYGNIQAPQNSAYNIWGSQGATNPYIVQGPGYTPATPETPAVKLLPKNVQAILPGGSDSWVNPEAGTYSPGNLDDWLTRSNAEKALTMALLPGVSVLGDLSYGINPLGDLLGDGTQTLDWYEGDTDYFGNPITSDAGETYSSWGGEIGSSDYSEDNYGGAGGWTAEEFESDFGLGDFGDLSNW